MLKYFKLNSMSEQSKYVFQIISNTLDGVEIIDTLYVSKISFICLSFLEHFFLIAELDIVMLQSKD